jgi:23S rRNA pseudouridine1911/1915/1917 synthase
LPIEHRFVVDEDGAGERLDRYLAELVETSRTQLQRAIREGHVRVDGVSRRPSYRVVEGDVVEVALPDAVPLALVAAAIPLDVVFEDEALIVVDKPAGLVVHPGPGHQTDTLVNALLGRGGPLSGIGGVLRPGIVHRLDRDTSGLVVVARSERAHLGLSAQFAAHTVEREYVALVARVRGEALGEGGTFATRHGRHPGDRLRFSGQVDEGREAITHYRVLERFAGGAAMVACRLETGRTHQIRMHFSEAGHPLVGDRLYGGRAMASSRLLERQALHARLLGFSHPEGGERLRFESPLPADLQGALDRLRAGAPWR